MKVPAGMKVYSGKHKYKAGEELPAHLSKKLEKKMDKQSQSQKGQGALKSNNKDSGK